MSVYAPCHSRLRSQQQSKCHVTCRNILLIKRLCKFRCHDEGGEWGPSVADPGFPRRGRQPQGRGEPTYYLANFLLTTALKLQGGVTSTPLDPPMDFFTGGEGGGGIAYSNSIWKQWRIHGLHWWYQTSITHLFQCPTKSWVLSVGLIRTSVAFYMGEGI